MGLLDNVTQQDYQNGANHGNYQFTSLDDVINQFIIGYVGEDKTISRVKRVDVAFHAQRALQELSFDTFKSTKAQEIILPASLQMTLPQDYVNYTKVSWVDSSGIKHLLYPASKTSNPSSSPYQNSDGDFKLTSTGSINNGDFIMILDTERPEVSVGMTMSVAGEPDYQVKTSATGSGVTLLTLTTAWTGESGNREVTFTPSGTPGGLEAGVLIPRIDEQFILQNLTWHLGSRILVAASTSDAARVKVGMQVSGPSTLITTGTSRVLDVKGLNIYISIGAIGNSLGGVVNFVSHKKNSVTWDSYKSGTPSGNQDDYQDDTYWPLDGSRYGLDPQHAQANGSFYIDNQSGKIHFSSNISGKTVILDYISDSLGTDGEMQVHKFAEEAMYKSIAYAILSTRANVQEYIVRRFKKERFAAIRTAKLRLSNLKLEELTQILRGKSKQIKH